ncbi:MAG: L,D-transpeptidase family protein [Pseudobdellovibrio sp.]
MKKTIIKTVITTITLFAGLLTHAESKDDKIKDQLFPSEILQISDDERIKASVLLADKQERKIYFFENNANISSATESYEIDIGKNDGPKTKRDDKKTPEGIYLLLEKITPPEIPFDLYGSMAFTTDYPNVFDKFENKTGSGIWLHSVPDTVPLNRGSRGCVILRNENIAKVSDRISLKKSYLIINAQSKWISPEAHAMELKKISDWINNWQNQWQNQDLENYIKLYSDDFASPGFNKKSWLKHKEKLKSLYSNITVTLSKPSIFHLKDQYIVKFIQTYSSDKYQDIGIKTLYLLEEKNQIQVLREEWAAVK